MAAPSVPAMSPVARKLALLSGVSVKPSASTLASVPRASATALDCAVRVAPSAAPPAVARASFVPCAAAVAPAATRCCGTGVGSGVGSSSCRPSSSERCDLQGGGRGPGQGREVGARSAQVVGAAALARRGGVAAADAPAGAPGGLRHQQEREDGEGGLHGAAQGREREAGGAQRLWAGRLARGGVCGLQRLSAPARPSRATHAAGGRVTGQ